MKALFASTLIAVGLTTAASAVTIDISDFTAGAFGTASGGLSNVVTEDFEDQGAAFGEAEIRPGTPLTTDVGAFSTLGGTGSGGTVRGLSGNTGTNIALRDGNVYGRRDVVGGRYFLDSNDTHGIGWDVRSTEGAFNTIVFALTDSSEYSYLRVIVDGVSQEQTDGARLRNGHTSLVQITFDDLVTNARIELAGYSGYRGSRVTNDGFSIDGIAVGIAAVPVPASLPLLAVGIGALAIARRKRQG